MDALCAEAWGDNLYGYENSLMAHIRRIREKALVPRGIGVVAKWDILF